MKPEHWNAARVRSNVTWLRRLQQRDPERLEHLRGWWHIADVVSASELDVLLEAVPAAEGGMLSIESAAQRLGVSRSTILREIAAGRLSVVKVRRAVRIPVEVIDAYRNANQRTVEPCLSSNAVPRGGLRSHTTGNDLDSLLEKARLNRRQRKSKRNSGATSTRSASGEPHLEQSTPP